MNEKQILEMLHYTGWEYRLEYDDDGDGQVSIVYPDQFPYIEIQFGDKIGLLYMGATITNKDEDPTLRLSLVRNRNDIAKAAKLLRLAVEEYTSLLRLFDMVMR